MPKATTKPAPKKRIRYTQAQVDAMLDDARERWLKEGEELGYTKGRGDALARPTEAHMHSTPGFQLGGSFVTTTGTGFIPPTPAAPCDSCTLPRTSWYLLFAATVVADVAIFLLLLAR